MLDTGPLVQLARALGVYQPGDDQGSLVAIEKDQVAHGLFLAGENPAAQDPIQLSVIHSGYGFPQLFLAIVKTGTVSLAEKCPEKEFQEDRRMGRQIIVLTVYIDIRAGALQIRRTHRSRAGDHGMEIERVLLVRAYRELG